MAKPRTRYVCQSCGSAHGRWQGQCPDCAEWNSLIEEAGAVVTPFSARHNLQGGGRRVGRPHIDGVLLQERLAAGRRVEALPHAHDGQVGKLGHPDHDEPLAVPEHGGAAEPHRG